jgi:hypothetical protein
MSAAEDPAYFRMARLAEGEGLPAWAAVTVKEVIRMRIRHAAVTAAVAGLLAGAAVLTPQAASAASPPLSDARVIAHFDFADGQTPENITLLPDGSADVSLSLAREVAHVSLNGKVRILATLPAPASGTGAPILKGAFVGGIVRVDNGTVYFLYAAGSATSTGVWELQPGSGPHRIAALPANSLPNGLALDAAHGYLYVADSVLSTVWRIPVSGGRAIVWATGPALAPVGYLGANGIKVWDGAVWVTNTDQGTVVRIPITRHSTAGRARVVASGLGGIDDFAFTGSGDTLIAALDQPNMVALVRPNGTHTTVLTATDGLENPSAVMVRGCTVYVTDAAYSTHKDPNLLTAHLTGGAC